MRARIGRLRYRLMLEASSRADDGGGNAVITLGDGAATPVISTLNFFRQDYLDYIEGRTAPRLSEKTLVGAH